MKQQCVSEQFISINDSMEKVARVFYIKLKMRVREQDSRETERERVLEAEHCGERKIVSAMT